MVRSQAPFDAWLTSWAMLFERVVAPAVRVARTFQANPNYQRRQPHPARRTPHPR
jgi:hypothetical protein